MHAAGSGTEFGVVSVEVANASSTEDGEVLELSASDGGAVVGDEDELGLSVSHGFDGSLVADFVLSGSDDQVELLDHVVSGVNFLSHVFLINI